MKKTKIIYWVITILFGGFMLFSAIPDIMSSKDALAFMGKLGYPPFILPFLGVAKALGVIAILIPGFPRIKEWAYAGLVFDLCGATYSFIALGYPASSFVFMFVFIALAFLSYGFYHKMRNEMAAQTK